MTIDAIARRSEHVQPQSVFSWALIGATTLPFIAFVSHLTVAVPVLMIVLMLGGTHVPATGYLFTDSEVRRFCWANPIKMIAIPSALMIAAFLIFSRPGPLFTPAVLALFLFQTWHFGAQNIGVASFISLSDRGRPLSPFEKAAMKAGIWVGILGVLHVMSPDFTIGESYMPLPAEAAAALRILYEIGKVLAIPLTGAALWFAITAWRQGQRQFGAAIFLGITFLFPMYLTRDFTIGFTSIVTAHGLQYLIFLAAHSAGRDRQRPSRSRIVAPAILLLFILGAGPAFVVVVHSADAQSLSLAFVFGVSLVHFWLDRFLWRMKDKDRAAWIKARFGAVLRSRPLTA
jgi:hypothetical protein